MILIHTTLETSIENIKKNGLISSEKIMGTKLLADYQNKYKPKSLPSFIDMKKCIYFHCSQDSYLLRSAYAKDTQYIEVISQNLDPKKLYVASKYNSDIAANIIAKALRTLFYENGLQVEPNQTMMSDKQLNKLSKMSDYKNYLKDESDCVKEYWDSLISFKEYEDKRKTLSVMQKLTSTHMLKTEILYFGDIPYNKINSISDYISMSGWENENL